MDAHKPHYSTVDLSDDAEGSELMSGTEVDHESLLSSDEKHWSHHRSERIKKTQPTIITLIKESRFFIDTILLLVIICLLLLVYFQPSRSGTAATQVGGEYTGNGLTFSTKTVKWTADVRFVPANATEFFSQQTTDVWNSVLPKGTGRPLENNTFSTTTMTHELHCLFMMGRIFHGITTNQYDKIPKDYHTHFMHCIDYLRQGVMCAADLATEKHDENDSDDFGPKDGGWNAHHVCKDYGEVIDYLDEQIKDGARIVLAIDD